jgi:hypothetical protein
MLLQGLSYSMTSQEVQVFAVDWRTTHGSLTIMLEAIPESDNAPVPVFESGLSKTFNFS